MKMLVGTLSGEALSAVLSAGLFPGGKDKVA